MDFGFLLAFLLLVLLGLVLASPGSDVPSAPLANPVQAQALWRDPAAQPRDGALQAYSTGTGSRSPTKELLLTLADGSVAAIDSLSGSIRWRSQLGSPLFLSSTTPQPQPHLAASGQGASDVPYLPSHAADGDQEQPLEEDEGVAPEGEESEGSPMREGEQERLIPGANGMLYEYSATGGLQELTYSVRELVQSSPSVTANGELIVGSRSTTVTLIDSASGQVLQSFNTSQMPAGKSVQDGFMGRCLKLQQQGKGGAGAGAGAATGAGAGAGKPKQGEGTAGSFEEGDGEAGQSEEERQREREACSRAWESALFLVRTDYVLKAFEMSSGELRWNVSYGEVTSLTGHSNRWLSQFNRPGARSEIVFGSPPEVGPGDGIGSLAPLYESDFGSFAGADQDTVGKDESGGSTGGGGGSVALAVHNGRQQQQGGSAKLQGVLDFVIGSEECDSDGGQGVTSYCVRMRDPVTGAVLWASSLPAVPLSAFSSKGELVQSFVSPATRTQNWASVLSLPPAGNQPGSTFVLPQPMPAVSPSLKPSALPMGPAGRAGKFTVPAVTAGRGGILVHVAGPHGRSHLQGIACDATGMERVPARPVGGKSSGGMPVPISRLPHPSSVSPFGAPGLVPGIEQCGDDCAQPPLPAPTPALTLLSFFGMSYAAVFTVLGAALVVGLLAAVPLVGWLQKRRGKESKGGVPRRERPGPHTPHAGGHRRKKKGQHTPTKRNGMYPPETVGYGQVHSQGGSETALDELAVAGEGTGAADTDEEKLPEDLALPREKAQSSPTIVPIRKSESGGGKGWGRWERDDVPRLGLDARRVGRLLVGSKVIGYGSHGTVVLEGELEGRPVAVKRLLSQFYEKARKEIAALIATDEHPNVVRCFAMEEDGAFVYVALERCTMSLADLITACVKAAASPAGDSSSAGGLIATNATALSSSLSGAAEGKVSTATEDLTAGAARTPSEGPSDDPHIVAACALVAEGLRLWDDAGLPTPALIGVLREVVAGLAHLHSQRIVHRDLKPQNVLVQVQRQHTCSRQKGRGGPTEACSQAATRLQCSLDPGEGCPIRARAKLSDMGISKRLADEASSFDQHTAGSGSSGWQAPEQLEDGQRQTRSVDLFPLGCLLYYCISAGRHPFGTRYERDSNVLGGKFDLFPVSHVPEAEHLIGLLLQRDPEKRPSAAEVSVHPLLWSPEMRLSFLKDASDRVESEDRVEGGSPILEDLEGKAHEALGGGQWWDRIDRALLGNLGMYRRYDFRSVRDLLRVIRNKCNHYRELPGDVQALFGTFPEGFEHYFRRRFPRLLMEVYLVLIKHCADDHVFAKYFAPHANHMLSF